MEKLIDSFKKYLQNEKKVAKNTFNAYSADIRHFFDNVRNFDKKGLMVDDLRKYLNDLIDQEKSAATRARKVFALRAFFGYAKQYHGIENIAAKLTTPKRAPCRPRTLAKKEDLITLFEVAARDHSARGLRNHVIIRLLYETGMKISELTALSLTNLSLEQGVVNIRQNNGKKRVALLSQELVQLLHEYHTTVRHFKKGYLLPILKNGNEQRMTRQACWLVINKLWKKAGITYEIYPDMLRLSSVAYYAKDGMHESSNSLRELYDKKHPRS